MRDIAKAKKDFPILEGTEWGHPIVYLDSAATTQVPEPVWDEMTSFMFHDNANASRGLYQLGSRATAVRFDARLQVAHFLNVSHDDIVFTANATQAVNLLASSWTGLRDFNKKESIAVSVSEHHSNYLPWYEMARKTGMYFKVLPDMRKDTLAEMITPDVKLVAVSLISNVLGTVAPIETIVEIAHSCGAKVLVDISQAVAHMPIDLTGMDVDFAVFSGHKMYAPTGTGILYVRNALHSEMKPSAYGGGMIRTIDSEPIYKCFPSGFEPGTQNVLAEAGLSAAIDYMESFDTRSIYKHDAELTDRLVSALMGIQEVEIIRGTQESAEEKKLGIVSFTYGNLPSHDVAYFLSSQGVCVRAGQHCAQPLMQHLHILGCVRASIGMYNTPDDIDRLVTALREVKRFT